MVEETLNSFKTWYQEKYGRTIEVSIIKTTFQTAFEKAQAYYVDPEADIWWGGPLSFFNSATVGLLPYNSTYKNQINATCRFSLQMDNRSTPYWYAASQYGLGIMYNKHVIDTLGLSKPETWADVLNQRYSENIAMTEPTNSEFTSLLIMLVLQEKMQTTNGAKNWTAGWEYLIKLAASIKEYDDSESDAALKVSSGYLPLAVVPDFYAYDKMSIPVPDINFTYLDATLLQPDPIAIFKKGKYQNEAKAFIDFILTQQAQSIIGKYLLPIRSDVSVLPPRINPFSSNFPFVTSYNKTFEEKMKQIVEDYYSVWITQKHSQVNTLWQDIIKVNKTRGNNSTINYYYKLAEGNFTYLGRYLNRTYLDTIYSLTGKWTSTAKKQAYTTLWSEICATTYAHAAKNIQLALGMNASISNPPKILLVTSMGNITIELYDDMPITSSNFKNLTEHGIYDGTIFHRVFHEVIHVIQGGDASGKGITVPTIADELPNKHSNVRGSVAMAKTSAPNSATSQFYINLVDNLSLDSNYSVFGKVIAGMNVVDAIGNVTTDSNDKPLQDVTVIRAEIIK
jgi:peptidylprolyl isomerase